MLQSIKRNFTTVR